MSLSFVMAHLHIKKLMSVSQQKDKNIQQAGFPDGHPL
jgi:hypothetical protein